MRDAVPTGGLEVEFRGRRLLELGREVLEISRTGLRNRKRLNSEGADETVFLNTLDEVVARGTTSAQELSTAFQMRWNESVEPLFQEHAY